MTSHRREVGFRIMAVFMSILVSLVVMEIVVRIIEPKETMRYFFVQPDSVLHHKFIPNARGYYKTVEFNTTYSINSLGLRDDEIAAEKKSNTYRIMVVGDSFTEGDGVEANETFCNVLERRLRMQTQSIDYQVINAGVGSYSPLLEFLYLTTAGLKLRPDLVVLFLDLSDAYDDIQYTDLAKCDSAGVPREVRPAIENEGEGLLGRALTSVKDLFKERTRLYNFVRLRIARYIEGARREGVALGDIRYDKYAMLRENYTGTLDSGWALSRKYILLIRDMLEARGIRFWVVVYPYGLQMSPREYVAGRQFWGFKTDTVYSLAPQEAMEEFCKRNSIHVVNMCPDFVKVSTTIHPLYFDYNGHWRPGGHELVAKLLEREFLAESVSQQ